MRRSRRCLWALVGFLLAGRVGASPQFELMPGWSAGAASTTSDLAVGDIDLDGDLDLACANGSSRAGVFLNESGTLLTTPSGWSPPSSAAICIALGDADLDGDLDLYLAGAGQGLRLHLNTGSVFAAAPVWQYLGGDARALALGDLDGDGYLDVCVGNRGAADIAFLNVGGSYRPAPDWESIPVANTESMALGDLDNDGDLDLACAVDGAPACIYWNTGGRLEESPGTIVGIAANGYGIALGDVDGDGDLDIATANFDQPSAVHLNGGVTGWTRIWDTSPHARSSREVILVDFDGDGDLDLAFANAGQTLTAYGNDGGSFGTLPAWESSQAYTALAAAAAEIDEDGATELIVGVSPGQNLVFKNLRPPFAAQPSWSSVSPAQTLGVAVGDIDNDGRADVAFANSDVPSRLYMGTPLGLALTPSWSSADADTSTCVLFRDLDNDGDSDLVLGNSGASSGFFRNDAGTFLSTPSWRFGSAMRTQALAAGDVNGDGWQDIVVGHASQPEALYLNRGGELPSTPDWLAETSSTTRGLALGDIDGDGRPDLVCGRFARPAAGYHNRSGAFGGSPDWTADGSAPATTKDLKLGDGDGDGDLDLVCAIWGAGNTFFTNDGSGLSPVPLLSTNDFDRTYGVDLADFDSDGDLDLVAANQGARLKLYRNSGAGPARTTWWESESIYQASAVAAGDLDGDGDQDLVCANDQQASIVFLGTSRTVSASGSLLPANSTSLRALRVSRQAANKVEVRFHVADPEGDNCHIVAEYQFRGDPRFHPMEILGPSSHRLGPFRARPDGVDTSFVWDIETFPDDIRSVVVRLRVVESPHHLAAITAAASCMLDIGPVIPVRPTLSTTTSAIVFPQVSMGDSVSIWLPLGNTGNADLLVEGIELPSPEMAVAGSLPLGLAPEESAAIRLDLRPRDELFAQGRLAILSSDPRASRLELDVLADIRDLTFTSVLFGDQDSLRIGQAVTIVIQPDPGVRLEAAAVHYRAQGSAGSFESVPFTVLGGDMYATIPAEDVTERGLEYYLEVSNSGVVRRQPSGAPADLLRAEVESPRAFALNAQPNQGNEIASGRELKVLVNIPLGAEFVSGTLFYRQGGSSGFAEAPVQHVPPLLLATIPADSVTPRGIECRAEINTLTSSLAFPGPEDGITVWPIATNVDEMSEPHPHPGLRYRMLSVPLEFTGDGQAVGNLLLDEFGDYDPTQWRLFRYDPLRDANEEYAPENPAFAAVPGKAYWLVSRDAHQVNTSPIRGLSVSTAAPRILTLEPGWNQIANPFAFPVAWSVIGGAGAVGGPVRFDPESGAAGAYAETVPTQLEPFEGYFVYNPDDVRRELSVPPVSAGPAEPAAQTASPNEKSGWNLVIRSQADGAAGDMVTVGVRAGASDAYDAFDQLQPPPAPGVPVRLCVDNTSWDRLAGPYRVDLRGDSGTGYRWRLACRGARPGALVTISGWAPVDGGNGVVSRLHDPRRGVFVDSSGAQPPEYSFIAPGRGEVYELELIVGTADYVERESAYLVALPARLSLDQNIPNPFNGATSVRFGLDRECAVDLAVYDLAGRRVALLAGGEKLPAGFHVRLWSGRDASGRAVASGLYVCRLVADGNVLTRSITYVR